MRHTPANQHDDDSRAVVASMIPRIQIRVPPSSSAAATTTMPATAAKHQQLPSKSAAKKKKDRCDRIKAPSNNSVRDSAQDNFVMLPTLIATSSTHHHGHWQLPSSSQALPALPTSFLQALQRQQDEQMAHLSVPTPCECTSLAFAPSGRTLWGGFSDGTVRCWAAMTIKDRRRSTSMEIACHVQAKGLHRLLQMHVAVSEDGQWCFAGAVRGSMELVAVHIGHLEERAVLLPTWTGSEQEVLSSRLTVFRHGDAKLRGFGACAQVPGQARYLLLSGKAIKNIHIWSFVPPAQRGEAPVWTEIYNTQSNGNTIKWLAFRTTILPDGATRLQALSRSAHQKLRVWDLSDEVQRAANSTKENNKLAPRPARPLYVDVPQTEGCLQVAGNLCLVGSESHLNHLRLVGLDQHDDDDGAISHIEWNNHHHTEVALPGADNAASGDDGGARRPPRGALKHVEHAAAARWDATHALLTLSDDSLVQYQQHHTTGLPVLLPLTRSCCHGVLPTDGENRQVAVAKVGAQGVMLTALATHYGPLGRGRIVVAALESVQPFLVKQQQQQVPRRSGFWGYMTQPSLPLPAEVKPLSDDNVVDDAPPKEGTTTLAAIKKDTPAENLIKRSASLIADSESSDAIASDCDDIVKVQAEESKKRRHDCMHAITTKKMLKMRRITMGSEGINLELGSAAPLRRKVTEASGTPKPVSGTVVVTQTKSTTKLKLSNASAFLTPKVIAKSSAKASTTAVDKHAIIVTKSTATKMNPATTSPIVPRKRAEHTPKPSTARKASGDQNVLLAAQLPSFSAARGSAARFEAAAAVWTPNKTPGPSARRSTSPVPSATAANMQARADARAAMLQACKTQQKVALQALFAVNEQIDLARRERFAQKSSRNDAAMVSELHAFQLLVTRNIWQAALAAMHSIQNNAEALSIASATSEAKGHLERDLRHYYEKLVERRKIHELLYGYIHDSSPSIDVTDFRFAVFEDAMGCLLRIMDACA